MSPILTPERYAEAYMRKKQNQNDIQRMIKNSITKSTSHEPDESFTHTISQNFLVYMPIRLLISLLTRNGLSKLEKVSKFLI